MSVTLRNSLLLVVLATGADDPRPEPKLQPRRILRGHRGAAYSVTFSADGKELASASDLGTVRLWNVATGKERVTLKGEAGGMNCVAFSPDGKVLASAGVKTLLVWDATTGKRRGRMGHRGVMVTLAFSPDGQTLAEGGGGPAISQFKVPETGEVRIWDVQTGRERLAPEGYTGIVGALAFSPDGRMLAGGDTGGAVTLWEVASNKVRAKLTGHHRKTLRVLKGHSQHVYDIALSKEGKLLVSSSGDRTIRFWDTSSGKALATISQAKPVWSIALSPDAQLLAAGVGETIKIWKVDEVLKQGARQPKRRPPPEKDKRRR
jgi:WD40 repeat protein